MSCNNCNGNHGHNEDTPQQAPEDFRRPVRVVVQAHVYYDDETSCTFTTPTLESQNMHPVVVSQFVGDFFKWIAKPAGSGFFCPRNLESRVTQQFQDTNDRLATQQVLIMPTQVAVTRSFQDNPNDSVLMAVNYPGCEFRFQMPILVGAQLGPPPNWNKS